MEQNGLFDAKYFHFFCHEHWLPCKTVYEWLQRTWSGIERQVTLQLLLAAWLLSLSASVYSRSLSTSKTCHINVLPKIRIYLKLMGLTDALHVCSCDTNFASQYYLLHVQPLFFAPKQNF